MSDQNTDPTPDEQQQPGQPDPAQDEGTDWKAEARKWEARARQNRQAAQSSTQQADAIKQAIAEALGIATPDDPKKLAESLTAAQREAANAKREAAILRRARTNGANPDALSDSASFLRSIEGIDPTDTAAIDAAIKAAVETNPALSATPNPGAGYRDTTAGRATNVPDADAQALRILGFGN